jgi:hypothetical protein
MPVYSVNGCSQAQSFGSLIPYICNKMRRPRFTIGLSFLIL